MKTRSLDKSYVTMEQKKCMICTKDFDSGSILMDTRMRERFDRHTLTGWGICPDDQKKFDDGYIALVGADYAKSTKLPNGTITPEGAYRTGDVIHMRFEIFERNFNVPRGKHPFMFVEPAVVEMIKKAQKECDERTASDENPTQNNDAH